MSVYRLGQVHRCLAHRKAGSNSLGSQYTHWAIGLGTGVLRTVKATVTLLHDHRPLRQTTRLSDRRSLESQVGPALHRTHEASSGEVAGQEEGLPSNLGEGVSTGECCTARLALDDSRGRRRRQRSAPRTVTVPVYPVLRNSAPWFSRDVRDPPCPD
ncbi:hypothetical protein PYCCODRAFT_409966 [Trametes coccinea BRFM310]|uniref:Uncharacterized protein n=1 Tax=Trametes coccinea (strain BRFM310) TaxID=1353009 RepID=A0A1Y2IN32_TRAC3|nr:hypothetical protein PYCCODRAFT_409966 [Trametes coccinea BRFM310]